MGNTKLDLAERPREMDGWRAGRPVEDPSKLKRWGFVMARPSEYLVHVRGGRVRAASSGQGAACFKWPWDSVAVVPTSLQKLGFTADQVTREKVGMQVSGLAVYRIADPLLAYRVLNFSFPERAQQKLEETLSAMFMGASRRLIANLTVEECLQKRKSALADELIREVAPIVRGDGHPDDATATGWGIVIDTIEIQEVRVLSGKLFDAMQAPYRSSLERAAREARADAERDIAAREAACRRDVEEANIQSELAVRARRVDLETAKLAAEAAVNQRRVEIERAEAEARSREAVARLVREATEAHAELDAFAQRAEAAARRADLARSEWGVDVERRRALSDATRQEAHDAAAALMARAQAERVIAESRARVIVAEKLPELAAAIGSRIGGVNITQFGGGTSPFASIAEAIASVVEVGRKIAED